jgi:hypothetical protein
MPGDVHPAFFAKDPAFTKGLAQDPSFIANLRAMLDPVYGSSVQGKVVGSNIIGADQTGIGTTSTGLTGFGITFNAVAGRRYMMHFMVTTAHSLTGAGTHILDWTLAGVDQAIIARSDSMASSGIPFSHSGYVELGYLGVGSKTIGISGRCNAGSMSIMSGSINNGRITILDAGP